MCINSHLDAMIYMKECQNDVSAIQKTFDDCESHIRELIALGMAEETFERVFAPLVISKFPRFVRVELNRKNAGAPWTLENLRQYLRDEITARQLGMQTIGTSGSSDKSPGKSSGKDRDNRVPNRKLKNGTASGMIGSGKEKKAAPQDKKTQKYPCAFCHSENHLPDNCDKYKTVNDRRRVLKPDQCLLCLGVNHKIAQCRSRRACKYCGASGTHHQSLCFKEHGGDRKPDSANASGLNADAAPFVPAGSLLAPASLGNAANRGSAILGTALAKVKGSYGSAKVRIVFDSCSTRSFVRLALLKDVKAKKIADEHLGLAGLAASERQYAKFGCYEIKLVCLDGEEITVAATGLNSVTCPVERQPLRVQDYPILKQFKLADPVEKPDGPLQLDVLIGLDQFYRFVGHIAVRLSDTLVLLETKLGYVVNGSTTTDRSDQKETALLSIECSAGDNQLDKNLERLWELEDVGTADPAAQLTPEEVIAIESFEKEISYDQKEKRYSVRWPWKENRRELPDNYGLALGRLKGLIKRIDKPTLVVYNDTIADQLKKRVVEVAPKTPSGEEIHYIRHHCVVRPDRATTKVRIVYDASAKASKSSPSLNDCMFPGPVILADLCGLLIRFRQGPIGIISDIEKAFLQVRLKPVDRDVTRFLWIKDINRPPWPDNLIVYRFTSVCFGVTASPYMLAGTIKHHLTKIGTPVAKQILSNCYVDNVITCVNSTSDSVAYYNEAKQLFNLASMNLREWFSNDQKFMICVDDNDQGNSRRTTILGMDWDLDSDSLRCRSKTDAETCCGTKRALLQAIAQLFDPCGLLSPVSITGKIMMQDLWKLKIGWDDQFSEEQRIRAHTIIQNLKIAVELSVPRHIGYGQGITVQLHCFVDASRAAYAAVTYQRTTLPDGFTKSRLLFSKAKVAPAKKPLTIPKLELSAVDLGAKLLRFLTTELRCPIGALFVWSDSMCAIQWVRGNFRKPVFVRNRVYRVRSVENLVVRYVPTAENPADIPTKGMTVDELEKTTLWWHGPRWLTLDSREWPTTPEIKESLETTDDTPTSLVVVEKPALPVVLENYSSLDRAINVLPWVRRFVNRARGKTTCGNSQITADEHTKALDLLISDCQREFSAKHREDYLAAVQDLNLFMDSNGIIRCDGRLKNSTVPYDTCFPIFVPRKSVRLKLLIKKIHEILGHAGLVHIFSELRSRYWIPRARSEIKKILADCMICRRWKGGPYRTPKPPPLPAFRVMEQPSFSSVGLDYAGPLHIRHRDGERSKVWICLFTCCTTRAVHLEVVTDMTENQFLLALRRFIGHRNTPELIVCDNAKQFRLSSKVTQDLLSPVVSGPSIQEFSAKRGINWKFIVEFDPRMGGMYERMVGLTKKSLRCMLQNMLVDLVELQTLCVEVSAILNSRPLTYCEDQLGYKPLTPNHLQSRCGNVLNPSDGNALEPGDYNPSPDSKSSLILRSKRLEARLSEFWKVWHKDYLTALSHQHWHPSTRGSAKDAPRVGSVVLVGDSMLPRGQWIMGRIEQLCQSGADDQVRAVIIRTAARKQLRRPLKLVYPLEIADVGEDNDKNSPDPLPTTSPSTPNPKPSQSDQRPDREAAVKARRCMVQLLEDEEADESIL